MWVDVCHSRAAGWALRAALIAAVLAGAMLLITPLFPDPEAHAAAPVRVDVAGERVELTRDVREAAERIARDYLSGELVVHAGNAERRISRRALGVRVDTAHLRDLLRDAADAHSPLRRVHAQALGQRPLQLPMPNDLDLAAASALVTQLKDITDVPALEPRIDPRARRVVPARQGAELDLFATLERIDAALRSGSRSVQAVIRAVPSKQTTRALEEIQLPAVMGEFETRYNRAAISEDRTHNLKLAAAKLDGFVLAPGQVFDFNAAVGDRTESTGFRTATVIADGELVDGMGGGTCQVASTLHAAVLFAGLPVLTRTPHSRPSFYIKLGLDATVVYGAQNFRFKNDRAYPIVLGLSVDEGRVYASVHGLARDRSVVFIRHIDSVTPFEERTSVDAKLPVGLRVLDQRGIPGFKVTRVRIIHDPATNQDVRERNTDSYPPTPQLWRIGIGGEARPGFERPRNDPHPEYVADEYLQMTQTERGTQDLLREPGRSGDYGWIERDGLVLRKP